MRVCVSDIVSKRTWESDSNVSFLFSSIVDTRQRTVIQRVFFCFPFLLNLG